jgi:hypothetical protein
VELAIGFEFRHACRTTRHQEKQHVVLFRSIQGRKRCAVREKHVGNEQIDSHPFKHFARVTDAEAVVLT